MADEIVHKQEYNIRNVATRSATLYPTRAQVIRDIKDITLQPGANEITIYGLTPTADESSIKVDGTGSAIITDMTVELVANTEKYEDIYPESDKDSDEEELDPDATNCDDETYLDTAEIRALVQQCDELTHAIEKVNEEKRSVDAQLAILKLYGDSMNQERPNDLTAFLSSYKNEREKAYDQGYAASLRHKDLHSQREALEQNVAKLRKPILEARAREERMKQKQRQQRYQMKEEKEDAKGRLRIEREQFWPRKVYRVVVTLETPTMTPASSRRGSTATVVTPVDDDIAGGCNISLSISYITSAACWAPCYDLNLKTTNNSGLIIYRAEFCNTTSETWTDTKVILSTSHTAFQGLGDTIPNIVPWHIKLNKKKAEDTDNTSGILYTSHELEYKQSHSRMKNTKTSASRGTLFGVGAVNPSAGYIIRRNGSQNEVNAQIQQVRQCIAATQESRRAMARECAHSLGGDSAEDEDMGFGLFDDAPAAAVPDLPSLETPESSWSESGLTATYDIPGLRTIQPSPTTRRQKIASISLKDVNLSYLLVPKLRAAAFIKARLHNTSSITLLKGPCGLTLDGSFLGNTNLPRCSAGDRFSLSLGVDPSVNVAYAKPIVKRSQTGVFQKEGSGIFTRTCTITNTRSDRILEGIVVDQVPVSEDERLRVEILQPAGLRAEGSTARCGTGISADGRVISKWGKTVATLKRAGFVRWDLKIDPGLTEKLVLEYETRFPTTEIAVGADDKAEESDEDMGFGLFD